MSMSISSVSGSQSSQCNSTATTALQKEQLENEIQKLQQEDAVKNQDRIKSLQSQLQLMESEILQQEQSSASSVSTDAAGLNVGPAYVVQLGQTQASGSIADDMSSSHLSNLVGPAYQVEVSEKKAL